MILFDDFKNPTGMHAERSENKLQMIHTGFGIQTLK